MQPSIQVIFGRNNLPFSWLIRIVTWSRWSHCGIVINDKVFEARVFKGVKISSTINQMVYTVRDIHTLGVKMSSKINWLVAHTSPGALVLQHWLTKHLLALAVRFCGIVMILISVVTSQ